MGQLFSNEEELSRARDIIGSLLYNAMLEAGAVPNLRVAHPLLLGNENDGPSIQLQMLQLQKDIGNRAPTYLRDLIARLSAFSDEPRLAGLVGSVVMMVIDMVYASSKTPAAKSTGSSSRQRVCEIQDLMEEYLKRCRMNLNDKGKLTQDASRLEAEVSLSLTHLKACLLRGDCDSRCVRQWASAAAFHTQMLVHLAALEGQTEPLAARAAVRQYKEDLEQIIPIYRKYKASTISVVKCRGNVTASCEVSSDIPEEGAMTGLTVTDRETGVTVTMPLCELESQIGRRLEAGLIDGAPNMSINLDLITSDNYAQAYLHHFFSDQGPVAKVDTYFTKASDSLCTLMSKARNANSAKASSGPEGEDGTRFTDSAEGGETETVERRVRCEQACSAQMAQSPDRPDNESLKLSIVETQPQAHSSSP